MPKLSDELAGPLKMMQVWFFFQPKELTTVFLVNQHGLRFVLYWLHNGSTVPHSPSSKHYIAATLFLPKLFPAKSSPKDTARRIARISIEAKLDMEEEAYVESFRPHIMDVVHAWVSVGHVTCNVGHVTCGFTH